MELQLDRIVEATCRIARLAGDFIRKEEKTFHAEKVQVKGLHDFVSYVDKEAERICVEALAELLPEAYFLTEEGTVDAVEGARYRWVIDPLDGTTNFIHGLAPYSVSIALLDGDSPVVGVVYEVSLDECFWASKGGGAWLNGRPVSVSTRATLADSLIATGFPYNDFHRMAAYMESLTYIMQHSHGARRLGSAAADLAYVACGRFEAFYEYSLKPWDVAAGVLLVSEAGGRVSDFRGGSDYLFGREMIATNAKVFDEVSLVVQKFLV